MTTQEGLPALATDEFIAELRAGLKGVTPGPWEAEGRGPNIVLIFAGAVKPRSSPVILLADGDQEANAAHIARLSPDRIRAVLARLEAAERDRDTAQQWAAGWHRIIETICTVLDLGTLDAPEIASAVRDKFEAAERQVKELTEALDTFQEPKQFSAAVHRAMAHYHSKCAEKIDGKPSRAALGLDHLDNGIVRRHAGVESHSSAFFSTSFIRACQPSPVDRRPRAMTTETPELEPCPWCGKPLSRNSGRANPYAVCTTEGCFGTKMPIVVLDYPPDIEAWNLRRSAASAEPAVAVKALVWDGDISRSVAGCYRLVDISQTGNDDEYWQATRNHNIIGEFGYPSIDDAKAAAQTNYELRIRSALAAPPPSPVVSEAMVATFRRMLDWFGALPGPWPTECVKALNAALSLAPAGNNETTVGKTQAIDPHKDADCGADRREDQPTVAPDAGWRDILSAPKDGSAFLALSGERWQTVCCWNRHRQDWCCVAPGYPAYGIDERPNSWRPLPPSPTGGDNA